MLGGAPERRKGGMTVGELRGGGCSEVGDARGGFRRWGHPLVNGGRKRQPGLGVGPPRGGSKFCVEIDPSSAKGGLCFTRRGVFLCMWVWLSRRVVSDRVAPKWGVMFPALGEGALNLPQACAPRPRGLKKKPFSAKRGEGIKGGRGCSNRSFFGRRNVVTSRRVLKSREEIDWMFQGGKVPHEMTGQVPCVESECCCSEIKFVVAPVDG